MEATQALMGKVSHPKLEENKNNNLETNKIETEKGNRLFHQNQGKGSPLKRTLKSLRSTQPLMCQK